MFDFAWSELAVIGVVALVVIGPKDLPRVLRTAGVMMRKARGMAREFQNSIDEMIREAELDEFRREVEETRRSLQQAAHIDLPQFHDPLLESGEAADGAMPVPPRLGGPQADENQLDLGLEQPAPSYVMRPLPAEREPEPVETPLSAAGEPMLPLDGEAGYPPPHPEAHHADPHHTDPHHADPRHADSGHADLHPPAP